MLTVVIRPAADPDRPMPLEPGVTIEAKRLLFIQSSVCRLTRCADYQHTAFKCVSVNKPKRSAIITMENEKMRLRFMINSELPQASLKIGDDCYTIEFADLMPHGKETP